MRRIIDFQTYLGDMFNEARSVVFKKPCCYSYHPDPLEDFEDSGYTGTLKPSDDLARAMQFKMWEKGNTTSAAEQMDQNGISYFVNLPVYPNTSFEEGLAASKIDARFLPFSSADFSLGILEMTKKLVSEIDLGSKGLHIQPQIQNIKLDDERVREAIRVFGSAGLPIAVHFGLNTYYPEGSEFLKDTPSENSSVENVNKLLSEHPDYSFILVHAAVNTGDELDSIQNGRNVYIVTSFKNTERLKKLADRFGEDRILFGSGFPFAKPAACIKQCEKAFSGEALDKVFYKNAIDLLKIHD